MKVVSKSWASLFLGIRTARPATINRGNENRAGGTDHKKEQESWYESCWARTLIPWVPSKGELSFPWNLLLYGYKTIIPSPAGDSVLLLGPVTRLVSKLSREDRTIGKRVN